MTAPSLLWNETAAANSPAPDWLRAATSELRKRLDDDFPCTFAPKAELLFAPVSVADTNEQLRTVRSAVIAYLNALRGVSGAKLARMVLIVLFAPKPAETTEADCSACTRRILQYLHVTAPSAWPADVPPNPLQPDWAFCFAGIPLFINAGKQASAKPVFG